MSENTENANVQPTADKPKRKRASTAKTYTVSQIAVARAKQRGIDTSRAAKEVRGILRANFATVCKLDKNVSKHKDAANDGNRWPAMNAQVAAFVLDKSKRQRASA